MSNVFIVEYIALMNKCLRIAYNAAHRLLYTSIFDKFLKSYGYVDSLFAFKNLTY